jgi:hypothetical protein
MVPGAPLVEADRPAAARRGARRAGPVPAVASAALGPLLGGDDVGVVTSAGATGVVVELAGGVLLVTGVRAARLPLSVHVGAVPEVGPGASVRAVGGELVLGAGASAAVLAVARWFDPRAAVAGVWSSTALDALDAVVAADDRADPLLDPAATIGLAAALAGRAELASVVGALVGRGGGLTPAGDDVLAGALAALATVGSPLAGSLAAVALPAARAGTTTLSAALLAHAARAEVAGPAHVVLQALADPAAGPTAIAAATRPLLALGHTSGHHLAAGIAVGARSAVAA